MSRMISSFSRGKGMRYRKCLSENVLLSLFLTVVISAACLGVSVASHEPTSARNSKRKFSVELPFFVDFPKRSSDVKNILDADDVYEDETLTKVLGDQENGVPVARDNRWRRLLWAQRPGKERSVKSRKAFPNLNFLSEHFRRDPERAAALETLRTLLHELRSMLASLTPYPKKDILASLYALAFLQKASLFYEEEAPDDWIQSTPKLHSVDSTISGELLDDLAYYSVFANAAYGWTLDLAWNHRLRFGDLQTILSHTNLTRDDIVRHERASNSHRPGYFIARDHTRKSIVVCVRGTWSAHDVLTDLKFRPNETSVVFPRNAPSFPYGRETITRTIRAHQGMLDAAVSLHATIQNTLRDELDNHRDYSLVLVGHSMGGGVCALLRLLLQESITVPMVAYLYGAPCVLSLQDATYVRNAGIVSVIMDGDPFSRLSVGHIADIVSAVSALCQDPVERNRIIRMSRGGLPALSSAYLRYCHNAYARLRRNSMTNEKLLPPGRILRLSLTKNSRSGVLSIREESQEHYLCLQLRPGMFDLQHHVPARYIWSLHQLRSAMQKT